MENLTHNQELAASIVLKGQDIQGYTLSRGRTHLMFVFIWTGFKKDEYETDEAF